MLNEFIGIKVKDDAFFSNSRITRVWSKTKIATIVFWLKFSTVRLHYRKWFLLRAILTTVISIVELDFILHTISLQFKFRNRINKGASFSIVEMCIFFKHGWWDLTNAFIYRICIICTPIKRIRYSASCLSTRFTYISYVANAFFLGTYDPFLLLSLASDANINVKVYCVSKFVIYLRVEEFTTAIKPIRIICTLHDTRL